MMRIAVLCVVSGMLAVAAPLSPQQPLQAGRTYQASTRVVSGPTGVSFVVADGFTGGYDADVEAFVMAQQAGAEVNVGVFAFSEGELEEVATHIGNHLQEMGLTLSPRDEGIQTPDSASGWFDVMSQGGSGVLFGMLRRGQPGNVIAVLALAPPPQRERLEPLVREVMQSAEFTTPEAVMWRRAAAGNAFTMGASGSDYSPGVVSGSGASGTTDQLDLCTDGTYGYQYHSETYVSIEGASASSESSDQHTGRWWLVADITGKATLVLEATDGREFLWPIVETQNGVTIDGTSYGVSPSQRCR